MASHPSSPGAEEGCAAAPPAAPPPRVAEKIARLADGDGLITCARLESLLRHIGASDRQIELALRAVDRDGSVEVDAWLAWLFLPSAVEAEEQHGVASPPTSWQAGGENSELLALRAQITALKEENAELKALSAELDTTKYKLAEGKEELEKVKSERDLYFTHVPPGVLSSSLSCQLQRQQTLLPGNSSYPLSCSVPTPHCSDACFGHIDLVSAQPGNFDGIAGGAGLLVLAPRKSDHLLVCDVKDLPSVELTYIDIKDIASGAAKFHSVAFDGDDLFACAPRSSDNLLLFSARESSVRGVDVTSVATGTNKYNGIAYGGGLFACVPYDADHMLMYRPDTGAMWGIDITHVAKGRFKFNVMAYGEGLFVGAPRHSNQILCHRLEDSKTWGIDIAHLVHGRDKFAGIAYGSGVFVLAPYHANLVLAYFPASDELKSFDVTGAAAGPQKFAGCTHVKDATFICSPFNSDAMLRLCPQSGAVECISLPTRFHGTASKFDECVFIDGFVACSPFSCAEILLYSDSVYARACSEEQGVRVDFLLGEFQKQAQRSSRSQDPNFHDLKHLVFGDQAWGYGKLCPRDGELNCSLVDALPSVSRRKATCFLSWVWAYSLSTVLGALQLWLDSHCMRADQVFVWMCYACNNQFRILDPSSSQKGSDNLEQVFEARLNSIGHMLALIDSWEASTYHTRIWTQFEQYTASKLGIPVSMILPPREATSLQARIDSGLGLDDVTEALVRIDAEHAKATFKDDEVAVKDLIRKSIGFEQLNEAVKKSMEVCVSFQFQELLKRKRFIRSSTMRSTSSFASCGTTPKHALITPQHSGGHLLRDLSGGSTALTAPQHAGGHDHLLRDLSGAAAVALGRQPGSDQA